MKTTVAFFIGVYGIVFSVLVAGLLVGIPSWLLGAAVFVLVLTLALWLALRPTGRRNS
jgi:MFS superfamily sulfate permease-like transporter